MDPAKPNAPRQLSGCCKTVSWWFPCSACSQIDTFDYKLESIRLHGQPMPGENVVTFQGKQVL